MVTVLRVTTVSKWKIQRWPLNNHGKYVPWKKDKLMSGDKLW